MSSKEKQREIQIARDYQVVKHNDLIQKSRFDLQMQEQKIILYLITKIKPEDNELKLYEFSIQEFCEICGIYTESGKNYSSLKATIKNLADKSIWTTLADGRETLLRWIERPYISPKSGIIKIKLDELMRPYLLELKSHFTAYNLYYTLAMKSKYSIRIYELLKSYEYIGEFTLDIEALKKMIGAEKYETYKDFRIKVLEIALREINDYSDISVIYSAEKKGLKYNKIQFEIASKKDTIKRAETFKKIERKLNS